jgi:hypothetical protein
VWQELRNEFHPNGLEVVTVALDSGGVEAAAPWIERAHAEHPSLVDASHVCDALFGIVNVPMSVWIDERGVIVRPPEPAWPGKSMVREFMKNAPPPAGDLDPYLVDTLEQTKKIRVDPSKYLAALRDWVANGEASRFALSADEVLARSRPRPPEESQAAAHFELAQHLWSAGDRGAAVPHFREAHRLQPDNWTYKRQAWSFVDPFQRPSDEFEGDWVSDIKRAGPENYYVVPQDIAGS